MPVGSAPGTFSPPAARPNGQRPRPASRRSRARRPAARLGVGAIAVVALALAGCGSHSDSAADMSSTMASGMASTMASAPAANASASGADIAFVEMMIPHHEQAIEMSDMALDPSAGASPQVVALATEIKSAQGPEIAQMQQWLSDWGVDPSAGNVGDHSGHGSMDMGMLSDAQMKQLSQATGTQFDRLWLEGMIAHHEGAVEMAEDVQAKPGNPQVAQLAAQIITSQRAEIAQMQQLLSQLQ